MSLQISTTYILVGLALSWGIAFYFYWRLLLKLNPTSRNRSYDILFLTIVLGVIVTRGVMVIANYNYYFSVVGGLQFLYFWDLSLNYLTLVYVPLLAYQFFSFNLERNLKWKISAGQFIAVGALLVMLVELAQLLRGLTSLWPSNVVVYHAVITLFMLVVIGAVAFQHRLPKLLASPSLLLVLLAAGIIASNVILPVQQTLELSATLVSQVVLCGLCLIPFVSGARRTTISQRVNPNDFRPL